MPPSKLSIQTNMDNFRADIPDQATSIGPSSRPVPTASSPVNTTSSRPMPTRAASAIAPLGSPSYLRSASTADPSSTLDTPATATSSHAGFGTPVSTKGRSRAHTVSVSMRSRARSGSVANSGTGERRSSIRSSTRDRSSTDSRGNNAPVQYDLAHEDGTLNDSVVGMLDCVDPEVSTVNHLQNISNTLIFPHLPALWSRRPEVVLPSSSDDDRQPLTASVTDEEAAIGTASTGRRRGSSTSRPRSGTVSRLFPPTPTTTTSNPAFPTSAPPASGGFAPIPELSPELATVEERELEQDLEIIEKHDELDNHVRNVLEKKKSKKEIAKQVLKGFWTYVKTPMGFIVAIYGFLVVFWGAAIVILVARWIPMSSKNQQDIWIEIASQIVNGLFTVTGVGLIPWRAMDTYRMSVIWTLKSRLARRRKQQGLPPIDDPNDIPDPKEQADYVSVLTEKEQQQLEYQQAMFAKSQTWYRPHATATHRAFPMAWALWNTILMDGNSAFQCMLCGTMWGLNRHERPAWTTGCLIPLSFLCGIGAAVLIWQGSVRTKKVATVEDRLRQALGVQMAIGGLPQTKDGTLIATDKRASSPPLPGSPQSSDGTDEKTQSSKTERADVAAETKETQPRRKTLTFGTNADKAQIRERGSTMAVPPSGEMADSQDMELREVASRPRVSQPQ